MAEHLFRRLFRGARIHPGFQSEIRSAVYLGYDFHRNSHIAAIYNQPEKFPASVPCALPRNAGAACRRNLPGQGSKRFKKLVLHRKFRTPAGGVLQNNHIPSAGLCNEPLGLFTFQPQGCHKGGAGGYHPHPSHSARKRNRKRTCICGPHPGILYGRIGWMGNRGRAQPYRDVRHHHSLVSAYRRGMCPP